MADEISLRFSEEKEQNHSSSKDRDWKGVIAFPLALSKSSEKDWLRSLIQKNNDSTTF